ncbi:MAG TPA: hypothetical protein VMQ81_06000, partial [Acidimicrobiia bacterium]|nr:hypothetical protein [Acidimicrobiia bacterium]
MATRFGRKGRKGTTEEPENTTPDKTKVDVTEAVKEAGTEVYHTKSGYRLPDGTLVSYDGRDDEAVGPAVDDGTAAVEQAARERLDDAPETVTAATEAEIDTAMVGAR